MLKTFDISMLSELNNGTPAKMIEHDVRMAARDAVARGGADGKARTVVVEISVEPIPDQAGVVNDVHLSFTSKLKIPAQRTRAYEARADAKGQLRLNPASDDDVKQGTLDEMGGADNAKEG